MRLWIEQLQQVRLLLVLPAQSNVGVAIKTRHQRHDIANRDSNGVSLDYFLAIVKTRYNSYNNSLLPSEQRQEGKTRELRGGATVPRAVGPEPFLPLNF